MPYSEIDGYWGSYTKGKVIEFQDANNLITDGIVGPQTWWALGGSGV